MHFVLHLMCKGWSVRWRRNSSLSQLFVDYPSYLQPGTILWSVFPHTSSGRSPQRRRRRRWVGLYFTRTRWRSRFQNVLRHTDDYRQLMHQLHSSWEERDFRSKVESSAATIDVILVYSWITQRSHINTQHTLLVWLVYALNNSKFRSQHHGVSDLKGFVGILSRVTFGANEGFSWNWSSSLRVEKEGCLINSGEPLDALHSE